MSREMTTDQYTRGMISSIKSPPCRGSHRFRHYCGNLRHLVLVAVAFVLLTCCCCSAAPFHRSSHLARVPGWRLSTIGSASLEILRGGSSVEKEEEEEEEAEEQDNDEEEFEVEEEEEEEVIESEEEEAEVEEEDASNGVQIELKVEKYDEPLVPSPYLNFYSSIGVMLLARRIDLFNPKVVRLARYGYIAFLIVHQLFLFYVRVKAVSQNDRTPIDLKSPLSNVLKSQLDGNGGGNEMMKNLASTFLSSKSTVFEYDLKQIRSMQGGMIFNMLLMWFLHFKMGQVQPLLIQSLNGIANIIYSPLFQVYVLGRNLERPFKNPAAARAEQAIETSATAAESINNDAAETVVTKASKSKDTGKVKIDKAEEEEESETETKENNAEDVEESDASEADEESDEEVVES